MLILLLIALAAIWNFILQAMLNLQDNNLDNDELKFFPICDNSTVARNDGKNERGN